MGLSIAPAKFRISSNGRSILVHRPLVDCGTARDPTGISSASAGRLLLVVLLWRVLWQGFPLVSELMRRIRSFGLLVLGGRIGVVVERRSHHRKPVNILVLTRSGEEQGEGTLVDISLSGALIESRTVRPRLGAPVKLRIPCADDQKPDEFIGTVTRHLSTGFAVRFSKATPIVRRLVNRGKVGL